MLINGNVGIGTTAPGGRLEIKSSSAGTDSQVIIQNDGTATGNSEIILRRTSAHQAVISNNPTLAKLTISQNHASGVIAFANTAALTERMRIDASGNVGIGITTPTAKLDINSDILRLRTAKTPATAGASGNQGDLCWDADFLYICVATNTWKKVAIATW